MRHQLLRLFLCISCLALSLPACAADNPYLQITGEYHGEVFNGEDMDAVITSFTLERSGRLSGTYTVDEENGAYSGTLSNIVFDDAATVSMEWTDKFGEGFAIMEFSGSFSSFVGAWTTKEGLNPLPWNGKK